VPSPIPTVIQSLAFSPDGAELAISGLTGTIDVFNTSTGKLRRSLPVAPDPSPNPDIARSLGDLAAKATGSIAWSPDGRTIAVGQSSTVFLLDAGSGAIRAQSTGHSGGSVSFGPGGRQLLVSGFGVKADILNGDTGAMIVDQFNCAGLTASQGLWSPSQGLPLVGVYESATAGSVCKVDPTTWRVTPLLHTSAVALPQITPEARLYVGLNLDPLRTFVHDLPSGILLGKLPGVGILSPNGRTVVSSRNGDIISWDLDPSVWQRRACEAAGRNLSPQEWDEYFPGEAYRPTCPLLAATPLPPG
jgi:WD40 repeat protein